MHKNKAKTYCENNCRDKWHQFAVREECDQLSYNADHQDHDNLRREGAVRKPLRHGANDNDDQCQDGGQTAQDGADDQLPFLGNEESVHKCFPPKI